ncbi:MAG: hypothetical protein LBF15_00995 [Candidatus Peribacteria bacterium]|nr:hypothetical protein [Candidatus Peribacteria bacterium]
MFSILKFHFSVVFISVGFQVIFTSKLVNSLSNLIFSAVREAHFPIP